MSDVAAIILAAGRGTRFGARQSKLTASWCGAPILGHVAAKALASGALPVILVTGHDSEFVERAVDGLALTIVHNTDYEQGLSTSLRAGLAALGNDISGTLVMLGDMPLVTVKTLSRLIAAHSEASADCAAIIPRYKGLRGNPALLRRSMFRAYPVDAHTATRKFCARKWAYAKLQAIFLRPPGCWEHSKIFCTTPA